MVQVAPESIHYLTALLLGHEGCGAERGTGSGNSGFGRKGGDSQVEGRGSWGLREQGKG